MRLGNMKVYGVDLPFYALFCLFSPFLQLHSPLCAFKK